MTADLVSSFCADELISNCRPADVRRFRSHERRQSAMVRTGQTAVNVACGGDRCPTPAAGRR
jgi:hypothetical protein